MSIALRCRCGQVRGEVAAARSYARLVCHCRYCQAYARFLGRTDVVDAWGGTDIVSMPPSAVRLTAGADRLACVCLSGKGPLRWYAACCRTPLANTAREASLPYAGIVVACLDAPSASIDAAFGAARAVLNVASATAPVRRTPLATALAGMRLLARLLAARLRGDRVSPFFDEKTGLPVCAPERLDAGQRAALLRETGGRE